LIYCFVRNTARDRLKAALDFPITVKAKAASCDMFFARQVIIFKTETRLSDEKD